MEEDGVCGGIIGGGPCGGTCGGADGVALPAVLSVGRPLSCATS